MRRWLRRLPGLLDYLLHGPAPDPEPSGVRSLMSHTHKWDRCRWSGQYWYARCIVLESCTARIAC